MSSDSIIPNTLSIELTLPTGEVGVSNKNGDVITKTIQSSSRESDAVLPAIDELMKAADLTPRELSLITVSIGPSGFTTMRIATTIAKHVSFVTGAPIACVPSAASAAEALGEYEPLLSIEAVKGDSFWLSTLRFTNNLWECEGALATVAEVQGRQEEFSGVLCNSKLSEIASGFEIPLQPYAPTAISLMRAGGSYFLQGETTEAIHATPLYPREPEAVRKWNAQRNVR